MVTSESVSTSLKNKPTYTGASDFAKLTRYLNTYNKTKNITLSSGKKYTYVTSSEYIKDGKTIYALNGEHYVYLDSLDGFEKILSKTSRQYRTGQCRRISEHEFEYIETLNSGMILKEISKITGIE